MTEQQIKAVRLMCVDRKVDVGFFHFNLHALCVWCWLKISWSSMYEKLWDFLPSTAPPTPVTHISSFFPFFLPDDTTMHMLADIHAQYSYPDFG